MNESDSLNTDLLYKTTLMAAQPFPPFPVEAGLLHGRAPGDDTGIIEHFALLKQLGLIRGPIAVLGNEGQAFGKRAPFEANPGMTYYRGRLVASGIDPSDIVLTDPHPDGTGFNTKTESQALIELARREGWQTAVAVVQPHQALRALAGSIKVMEEINYKMAVWYASPLIPKWQEEAPGSQALDPKPRWLHAENELSRIETYIKNGSIVGLEQVLKYLLKRDHEYMLIGSNRFYLNLKNNLRSIQSLNEVDASKYQEPKDKSKTKLPNHSRRLQYKPVPPIPPDPDGSDEVFDNAMSEYHTALEEYNYEVETLRLESEESSED